MAGPYLDAVEAAIGRRLYPAGAVALVQAGITPSQAADIARLVERREPGVARNLAYLMGAPRPAGRAPPRASEPVRLGSIIAAAMAAKEAPT